MDTRDRLLTAAAKEFGKHGYSKASLNQILAEAGVSKSSAYHHFADKADLAATVVERYWAILAIEKHLALDQLTADTFWPSVRKFYGRQFELARDHPWMLAVLKAAPELLEVLPTKQRRRFAPMLHWLKQLYARGQALKVLRDDIPSELLISMLMALDRSIDTWVSQNAPSMSEGELRRVTHLLEEIMVNLLAPRSGK